MLKIDYLNKDATYSVIVNYQDRTVEYIHALDVLRLWDTPKIQKFWSFSPVPYSPGYEAIDCDGLHYILVREAPGVVAVQKTVWIALESFNLNLSPITQCLSQT